MWLSLVLKYYALLCTQVKNFAVIIKAAKQTKLSVEFSGILVFTMKCNVVRCDIILNAYQVGKLVALLNYKQRVGKKLWEWNKWIAWV